MEKKKYNKVARIVVKDGTYIRDGIEKNRWQEVGVLMSTEHGSNMFIRLNATATSPSTTLSIFKEDGVDIKVETQYKTASAAPEKPDEIDISDIPF